VGKITKQWSGLAKEYFTDADNFGIQCKWINLYGWTRRAMDARTHTKASRDMGVVRVRVMVR